MPHGADQILGSRVWPTGTRVELLSVPWDAAYRNAIAWQSAADRDAWFARQTGTWVDTQFSYLKPGAPVPIPLPYSSAYKYNYIAVTNPAQPVDAEGPVKTYYYFVTGVEYVSPQTTHIYVQLDVVTTYAHDIEFADTFVEAGHIGIANENLRLGGRMGEKLLQYCDRNEGLDVGAELVPVAREFVSLQSGPEDVPKIVIVSTANLAANPGTVDAPALNVATGQFADGLPSGCNVYWVARDMFSKFLKEMSDKSWVAQCIVAIYAFPGHLLTDGPTVQMFGGGVTLHFMGTTEEYGLEDAPFYTTSDIFEQLDRNFFGSERDLLKLYSYPYSVIELSTLTGNPIYLKPQLVKGNRVMLYWLGCALAPFAKVGFFPRNYGSSAGGVSYTYTDFEGKEHAAAIAPGDFLDNAIWITDFPQFSIVNNAYITYMASTSNSRRAAYEGAAWSQQSSYLQLNNAYHLTEGQLAVNEANWGNQQFQNGIATVTGGMSQGASLGGGTPDATRYLTTNGSGLAVGADLSGGSMGMALGAVQMGLNMLNSGTNMITQDSIFRNNQAYTEWAADKNRALSRRVATGNYEQSIRALNAKYQDAALTPPATVGQMGGEGFNWKNGLVGFTITYKSMTEGAKTSVVQFFQRFGYQVGRWMRPGTLAHMLCMSRFAYWKLQESVVTCASANEAEREAIRGVFEKGVTLWDAPESIGNTDLSENRPREGYRY